MGEQFSLSWILKLEDQMSSGLDKLAEKLKKVGVEHKIAGERMREVGKGMTLVATTLMGGAAALAMNEAKKMDTAFVNMQLSIKKPIEALTELKHAAHQMSIQTNTTAEELTEYMVVGAKSHRVSRLEDFAKNMANLATATGEFVGANGAQQFMELGIAIDATEKEYEKLGDVLAYAKNNFNVSAGAMGETMKSLASLGPLIGITTPQIAGMSAWANSFGQEGGQAMIRMLNMMAREVKTGHGAMLGWYADVSNMNAEKFMELFKKNPAEAFAAFAQGTKDMNKNGKNMQKILEQMGLDGGRLIKVLGTAANAAGDLGPIMAQLSAEFETGGYASKAAAVHHESYAGVVGKLGKTYSALMEQFGEIILPGLKALLSLLQGTLEIFTGLPGPIKVVIAVLGGLLAVTGPILLGMGTILGQLALMKIAFPAAALAAQPFVLTMGTLALAIGKIAAVAAVGYAFGSGLNWLINKGTEIATGENGATLGGKIYDWTHPDAGKGTTNRSDIKVTVGLADGLRSKGVENKGPGSTTVGTEYDPYAGVLEGAF